MGSRHPNLAVAALAVVSIVLICSGAWAQQAERQPAPNWLTGRQLDAAMERSIGIAWPGNFLADSLARLSHNQRVAVWLHRRVDPNRRVNVNANEPLNRLLESIVAEHNAQNAHEEARPRPAARLGVTRLGDIVIVAPVVAAAQLRTVAENRRGDLTEIPNERKVNWLRKQPLSWDEGATPREILAGVARRISVRIGNLDGLPHDLLPAADLPPLTAVDSFSIILANYDLTYRIVAGGTQMRLEAIDEDDCRVEKKYSGGADPQQLASDISAALPDVMVEIRGRQLVIQARVEEHEWISGARERSDSPVAGTQVHSLNPQNAEVGQVIDYLAEQLDFEVRWEDEAIAAAGLSKQTRITTNVVKQPLDKLLEMILEPAGLAHRREGEIVIIGPKD